MCGIAGIIDFRGPAPGPAPGRGVDREALRAMAACIAHRGPDAEGIELIDAPGASVGLAHRRLAIIDLDPRANQPFTDGVGRWIVFNGEIYNYRELRAELEAMQPGRAWRTTSDTEVLLAAVAAWGEACLEKLDGMFAFAVWDGPNRRLILARDRIGQKPLYWTRLRSGKMAFASELGALRRLPGFDRMIDPTALADYLEWGYVPAPRTIYASAHKVPPATWMIVTADGERSGRWFDPNEILREGPNLAEAVDETRRLVRAAVARQLVADVPVGCFLSGGADSSIVAAAIKRAAGADQPVLTFSVGFDDPRYDETRYAAAVARHLGTRHREYIVRPDAAADLPKLAGVFGEPFADSSALPTHYLSREVRREVKVALSGDGGDELFGGYERYRAVRLGIKLQRVPGLTALLGSALWQELPGTHPKSRVARIKRFLATIRQPEARRYAGYMRLFSPEEIEDLLQPEMYAAGRRGRYALELQFEALCAGGRGRDPVQAALALDRVTYLPEDLLTKVDRCSMLHNLEVRSPFMDGELVHFAAGLSADELLGGGPKRMLRAAFAADLPAWVFKRRKMGFAVPIGQWLRTTLRPMLQDLLFAGDSFAAGNLRMEAVRRIVDEHEQERADHSQRLYALLMLELWWRGER